MKINGTSPENEYRINTSAAPRHQHDEEKTHQRKTVYVGNALNPGESQDPMDERRTLGQKMAMKVVQDAFKLDSGIDDSISEMKQHREDLTNQIREIDAILAENKEAMEEVGTDNPELAKSLLDRSSASAAERWKLDAEIKAINGGIREIGKERLKESPMADAKEAAEGILDEMNKTAMQTMTQEAKDKLDEMLEEKKEESEQNDKKDTDDLTNTVATKVDEILNKLSLIEEDIKGIEVDEYK